MKVPLKALIFFLGSFVFLGPAFGAVRSTDIRVESSEKELFSSTKKKEPDEENWGFFSDDSKRVGLDNTDLRGNNFF